jgi:cullin-associated NEDD8-dissociated protein 1
MDRHEESLRSCLRAVDALDRLAGSSAAPRWVAFMQRTAGSAALRDKLAAVRAEREEAESKGAAGRGSRVEAA